MGLVVRECAVYVVTLQHAHALSFVAADADCCRHSDHRVCFAHWQFLDAHHLHHACTMCVVASQSAKDERY